MRDSFHGAASQGFKQRRASVLASLSESSGDKSRKGSVDAPIADLVVLINSLDSVFTTSSCSGRLSVFGEPSRGAPGQTKKGGEWVYVTHERPVVANVIQAVTERVKQGGIDSPLILRFEPFILAAECQTLQAASQLIMCGREAGFRESGMTVTPQRIIASIRSSSRLEMPVVAEGKLLVPHDCLDFLIHLAQERFDGNGRKVHCFYEQLSNDIAQGKYTNEECAKFGESSMEDRNEKRRNKIRHPAEYSASLGSSTETVEWRQLAAQDVPLQRWGHSACEFDGNLIVFGGYGGSGAHHRLNDIIHFSPETDEWCIPQMLGDIPSARIGHTCTNLGKELLIFGGRMGPAAPLNDTYICTQEQTGWLFRKLEFSGSSPSLFRHSATAYKGDVIVFGGASFDGPQNKIWILDKEKKCWKIVESHGSVPSPRMGHAACLVASTLYVHGGFSDYHQVHQDLYSLDLSTFIWSRVEAQIPLPACFSHSMTPIGKYLMLFGGCPRQPATALSLIELNTGKLTVVKAQKSAGDMVPVRHTATVVGSKLYCIGGGAFCFSFGSLFGNSWSLDLCQLDQHTAPSDCIHTWACWIPKALAKKTKDALKSRGWLDIEMKSAIRGDKIGLPILESAAQICKKWQSEADPEHTQSTGGSDKSHALVELILKDASIEMTSMSRSKRRASTNSHGHIKTLIKSVLLESQVVPDHEVDTLILELPTKWEKLGDLVLIPEDCMLSDIWESIGSTVWIALANGLGASRIGRQCRIASQGTRDSQVELLYGTNGWVQHKENGVIYSLDVTRCMFSSGNVTERGRMGGLDCSGETIVDLYTGIGYYTLPLLCKAKAEMVHACEWNPHAIEGLVQGLKLNGVSDKCQIHQGDCRQVAPVGCADRVLLGLLPSSEDGWETALRALKPSGGWLHVHCNVLDKEELPWKVNTVQFFKKASMNIGREWKVEEVHCERVKWYAPHIRHVVLDIRCIPEGESMHAVAVKPVNIEIQKGGKNSECASSVKISHKDKLDVSLNETSKGVPTIKQLPSQEVFQTSIVAEQKPVIIKGAMGTTEWTFENLISHPESESTLVSVHVCPSSGGQMDFFGKNYSFHTVPFREALERCLGIGSHPSIMQSSEKYYLRTIGKNPRKEPSCLSRAFPELSKLLHLPRFVPDDQVFSTILRVSSPGIRLWTHFDAMDNVLLQVQGTKSIRLWAPEEEPNLYVKGSTSQVTDIENPDESNFPSFSKAQYVDCKLEPGDALFIPALWFHNVLAEEASISINIFFHHISQSLHDKKDLYGNREPLPVQEADKFLEGVIDKLDSLPSNFKNFYGHRLCRKLEACLN